MFLKDALDAILKLCLIALVLMVVYQLAVYGNIPVYVTFDKSFVREFLTTLLLE